MRGYLCRDELGNALIDSNGNVQCIIEDGRTFQIKYDEINFSCNILKFMIDDLEVSIDLFKEGEKDETYELENANNQSKATADAFPWDDASTKLFLSMYKCKKDLVSTRKIKTYKLLWNKIAEDMGRNGYLVSPLQVENKFKSLMRSYKNMISNNKKTGRGRTHCKFENELTDLFSRKHNITPLALSGKNGLVLREEQSEKENNASLSLVNHNNEFENELDDPCNVAGNSVNISNMSEKNKCPPKIKSRNRTTENLKECLTAIELFTSEIRSTQESYKNMQIQILEEFKNIKKTQEDFMEHTKKQWIMANTQREERNKILKEIAKNDSNREFYF